MKYRNIFPAIVLCLGMLSGCGAARPSKFYQLTAPTDKTSGDDLERVHARDSRIAKACGRQSRGVIVPICSQVFSGYRKREH